MVDIKPGDVILIHRGAIGNKRALRVRVDGVRPIPPGHEGKHEVWGVEVTRKHLPRVYFASRADTSRSRVSEWHAFLGEDGWEIEAAP